jgi:hypothetical protein
MPAASGWTTVCLTVGGLGAEPEDFLVDMGVGGAHRGGPKGEKGCGKLLTGVGTACADAPPMTPHTAFGIRLKDGLGKAPVHRRCIACLAEGTAHLHARSPSPRTLFLSVTARIRFWGGG